MLRMILSLATRKARMLSVFASGVLMMGSAVPAHALTMTVFAPTNTSSSTTTGNAGDTSAATSATSSGGGTVADLTGNSIAGAARLAWNVTGDSTNTTADTRTLNANYSVTFSVVPTFGATTYNITINTSQNGAWTYLNDATTNGSAGTLSLSTVTSTLNAVSIPSLNLAGIATAGNALSLNPGAPAGTATEGAWGGNGLYTLTGLTGANTYTLNFAFTARATTAASSTGDEVSYRYGLDSTLANVSADNYPGVGGSGPAARVQANDGHFVGISAAITYVPEPSVVALVGMGLAGLATHRRRK